MKAREGNEKNREYFRIGELAKRAGVNQRTLRFYEERGLLEPTARFRSGMRLYSQDDVERVHLIRELQETLGFSLAEIKEIIAAEENEADLSSAKDPSARRGRSRLKRSVSVTRSQLSLISEKLARLERLREHLEEKLIQHLESEWTIAEGPMEREALLTNRR
jgi:DNA-binding transcriptional MerR regulator